MVKVPDWKNADDYKFIQDLISKKRFELVAWEFLRRNCEYQADYSKLASNLLPRYFYSPPKEVGESESTWAKRCLANGAVPNREYAILSVKKKWHLVNKMLDPNIDALTLKNSRIDIQFSKSEFPWVANIYDDLDRVPTAECDVDARSGPVTVFDGVAVAVFSLAESIPKQLEAARKLLRERQLSWRSNENLPSISYSKSPDLADCLRTFDAIMNNTIANENLMKASMAEVIFGKNTPETNIKFRDCERRAALLVESKYIFLAIR